MTKFEISMFFIVFRYWFQLIPQVRCVDHRPENHRLPLRPHTLPAPGHYPHPLSANPYMNYPPPYNLHMPNPFAVGPYQIPAVPQMYQPPFAPPFGFMPYTQQPGFPFAKYPGPYMPPSYPAEDQAAEPWPSSASNYMVPSSQLNYMTPLPQSSHAPSSGYTLWNSQFSYPSSRYPLSPQFSFPGSPYMTPNIQHPPSGYTPNLPPNYLIPSPPGYSTANPQISYVPQPNSIAPSSQTTLHTQSPQTHVSHHPTAQAILAPSYPANRTSAISYQSSALSDITNVTSADNFTGSIIPGIASPENVTQNLATPLIPAPGNQPTNDFAPNPLLSMAPETGAETKVISSNGETSTDLNSLPPQVRDFIDMIPNILAMPESSALKPNDQLQHNSIDKPRPLPFSLHKRPKGLPFLKRKTIYPPSPYFQPAYLQPSYLKLPYQQHLPISSY